MCSRVCLRLVPECGRWWPSSTTTHSRATLQSSKSKNMVSPSTPALFFSKLYIPSILTYIILYWTRNKLFSNLQCCPVLRWNWHLWAPSSTWTVQTSPSTSEQRMWRFMLCGSRDHFWLVENRGCCSEVVLQSVVVLIVLFYFVVGLKMYFGF